MTEEEIETLERQVASARKERADSALEKLLGLENDTRETIAEIAALLPSGAPSRRPVEALAGRIGECRNLLELYIAELARKAEEPLVPEPSPNPILPVPSA